MRRVARLRIRNILGIDELDIEPGKVTEIRGRNASGKTSILEAVRAAIGGGHDATLLRKGEQKGETVLVLDDGIEVQKEVTASGSKLSIRHPELGAVSRPQGFLDGITDALAVNPVAFLTAKGKERAKILLEAIPMRVEPEQLAAAIGVAPADLTAFGQLQGHALEVIDGFAKSIYTARRDVNRTVKEKRTSAEQLRDSLPEDGVGPDMLRDAITQREEEVGDLEADQREKNAAIHVERTRRLDIIRSERDEALEQLRIEYEAKAAQVRAAAEQNMERVNAELDARRDDAEVQLRPAINRAKAELVELRAKLEQSARDENTRQLLERMEREAESAEGVSARHTAQLEALDQLKSELLAQLPIPGLEVRDGEIILVNGIEFDRLNHGEQIKVAVRVAKLRAGDLRLVTVDGMEALDDDAYTALLEALAAEDLQVIVTRVAPQDLTISTRG